MLDICLLGTGGTMPLPGRALTALMARYKGKSLLIDCGEGTQVAVREQGWSMKPIDMIFFTHFHADHITGLPGLLLTLGKQGRTETVQLIGPKGLAGYVRGLCVAAPELPYPLDIVEIQELEQTFFLDDLRVEAFAVDHSIPCYNYSLNVDRAGKFEVSRALAAGVEKRYWGRLQKGETIVLDGRCYTPDMVLGRARKGIKVTYCTDTRPTARIETYAAHANLFICEGMYGAEEQLEKAVENKHMTFREAAELAKKADARELWLTHYSPSLRDPQEYMDMVRGIFPHAVAPEGRRSIDLCFDTSETPG